MENNKLTVSIDSNKEITINVYDIIEKKDTNKQYIIYNVDESETEDIYISILEETDNAFTLKTIKDEFEYKEIEKYLIEIYDENGDLNVEQ
jgi:hypothetical protein